MLAELGVAQVVCSALDGHKDAAVLLKGNDASVGDLSVFHLDGKLV